MDITLLSWFTFLAWGGTWDLLFYFNSLVIYLFVGFSALGITLMAWCTVATSPAQHLQCLMSSPLMLKPLVKVFDQCQMSSFCRIFQLVSPVNRRQAKKLNVLQVTSHSLFSTSVLNNFIFYGGVTWKMLRSTSLKHGCFNSRGYQNHLGNWVKIQRPRYYLISTSKDLLMILVYIKVWESLHKWVTLDALGDRL